MAAPGFIDSISANLAYWHSRMSAIDDPAVYELRSESQNMYRAVEFGLALPETWRAAAELIIALNYSIEHDGSWRPWLLLLRQAIAQCGEVDTLLKLRLLNHLGQYYRLDRDWEASLAALKQAELLARALGEQALLAQAHLNLGMVFWRRREYTTAAAYAQQALAGFQEAGATDRQLGGAFTGLGLVDYGRGAYAAAVEAHMQAVAHFRQSDFTVLLARSLVNLALAQEANGDVEGAKTSYFEARLILQQSDYEREKTRLELSLGTLLINMNRLEEAEDAFLRAYSPYLKRSGLIYFQGLATNNLGNVYLEQGRLAEAEAILRESLALWERAHARLQAANTMGTLARTLAAQGKISEATVYYEAAVAGVKAFPEDGWARQILDELRLEEAVFQGEQKERGQVVK